MKINWSNIKKRIKKLLIAVPLLLVLASTQVNAVIGFIIAGIVIYLVALIVRMAFISKYILMFLIVLNPCIMAPCPTYDIGSWSVSVPEDPVVKAINKDLLGMFQAFYVIAILYYAAYVIFLSSSPSARAKGKNMLISLLVGMVLVSQSRPILQLSMDISKAVTYSMIGIANQKLAELGSLGMMARAEMCIMDLLFMSLGMVAVMMAGMRYFFILLMSAFFPLALFLYFIPFTKNYGIILIRFTMLIVFIQVIQALLYSVTIISAVDETGLAGFIIAIGGLFGVIYSPLLGMKLMGWLGAVTHFYSTRAGGASTRFMAMLMRGQPVGTAFQTAGAQYMISHNMGPAMRGLAGAPMAAAVAPPAAGWPHERPTAGYGIRSARSFRGRVEGRSGVGAPVAISPVGGGRAGAAGRAAGRRGAPEGEGDYYVYKDSKAMERYKTGETLAGAAGAAGPEAAMAPGGGGRPTAGREAAAPGIAARAMRPSIAARRGAGEAAAGVGAPRGVTPETGSAAAGVRPIPMAGMAAAGVRPIPMAGMAAAGTPAEEGSTAVNKFFETEDRRLEEQGKIIEEKERQLKEKAAPVESADRKSLDDERRKHKEEMNRLYARKNNLLAQLKKTGLAQTADNAVTMGRPEGYQQFLNKATEKGVQIPEGENEKQKTEKVFSKMSEVPAPSPKAAETERAPTPATPKPPARARTGVETEEHKVEKPELEPKTEKKEAVGEGRREAPEHNLTEVKSMYDELKQSVRALKGSGRDVSGAEHLMEEASGLMGGKNYDEAYKKLENAKRGIGL